MTTQSRIRPPSGPLRESSSRGLSLPATLANGGLARLCGQRHDPLLRGLFSGELARDPAPTHHQYPVAHPQDLRQVARYHQYPGPIRSEIVHQLVDLDPRAHVYPAGWLVHDHDPGVRQEPPPDDDLLLVAAREVAHLLIGPRC